MRIQFSFGRRDLACLLLGLIIGISLFRLYMVLQGQNPHPEHAPALAALSGSLSVLGAVAVGTWFFYGWRVGSAIGIGLWAVSHLVLDAFVLSARSVAGWGLLAFALLLAYSAWKHSDHGK